MTDTIATAVYDHKRCCDGGQVFGQIKCGVQHFRTESSADTTPVHEWIVIIILACSLVKGQSRTVEFDQRTVHRTHQATDQTHNESVRLLNATIATVVTLMDGY